MRRFSWNMVVVGLFSSVVSACVNQNDYPLFRWQLDDAIQHGRSVEHMFLSNATGFRRSVEDDASNGGKVWKFTNDTIGCEFLYITDSEGRGVKYRFLSPEENCVLERKSSGW